MNEPSFFCNVIAFINFFSHLNSEYKTKRQQKVNKLVKNTAKHNKQSQQKQELRQRGVQKN